jgi:hypothetical protein
MVSPNQLIAGLCLTELTMRWSDRSDERAECYLLIVSHYFWVLWLTLFVSLGFLSRKPHPISC